MERTAPDLRVRRAKWTRLRSLPFLAGLGLRAVRRRALQSVLAAVGTAVAVALAVAAAVGAVAVHDRTLATAIATLPPERQAVAVTWVGTSVRPDDRWPALDRAVWEATGAAGWERPARLLAFRQSRVGGRLVWFGALEDLRGAFRLGSGRYPRRCAPTRCEVLQAGPGAAVAPAGALVPVGRAVARRGSAAGAFFRGGSAAVLVGEGVAEASRVGAFGAFRTYAWLFPLDRRLHPWELDDLERATVTASLRLTRASPGFGLQAPLDELRKVDRRARAAGRRLEIVGVFAGLLLIAFLVLVRLLAEAGAERRQRALHHHGAARWQASAVALVEAAAVAGSGALAGALLGVVGGAALAEWLEADARPAIRESLLAGRGAAVAVGFVLAVLGVALVSRIAGGPGRWLVATVALAAAVAGGLALLDGGSRGAPSTLEILAPGLLALAAAVALAWLVAPAAALLQPLGRRAGVSAWLAVVSIARAPLAAAVAVAFVALAVGLGVFAAAYRGALEENQRDAAAFAVPLEHRVTFGRGATVPEELPRSSFPVNRLDARIEALGREGATVLALPSAALPRLGGWRGDFARERPAALALRLRPPAGLRYAGPVLPRAARELRLPVDVRGDRLAISVVLRTRGGRYAFLQLGGAVGGHRVLRAAIPADARGGTIAALRFAMPEAAATGAAHRAAEDAPIDVFARGRLTVERFATDAGAVRGLDFRRWTTGGSGRPSTAGRAAASYFLTPDAAFRLRPAQPFEDEPIPALVSPSIARLAGSAPIPMRIGEATVLARGVATAELFPTLREPFVVLDRTRLELALAAGDPARAAPNELWIGDAGWRPPPTFEAASVLTRAQLESRFRSDPLARGTLALLVAAGLGGLALALTAVALLAVAATRDAAGRLFDLEAQGFEPRQLRAHVRLSVALVVPVAAAAGVALGLLMARVFLDLVPLGAGAELQVPAPRADADWPVLGVGAVFFAAVAAAVVAVATRRAFRAPDSGRSYA